MALRKSRDVLKEKRDKIVALEAQANYAVNIVTSTIDTLGAINRQIDSDLQEIDEYANELEATRLALSGRRKNNEAIIANFSKLIGATTD